MPAVLIREPLVESPGADDLVNKTLIISDFGMSCPTDSIGSHESGVGTAAYAAPEVIRIVCSIYLLMFLNWMKIYTVPPYQD